MVPFHIQYINQVPRSISVHSLLIQDYQRTCIVRCWFQLCLNIVSLFGAVIQFTCVRGVCHVPEKLKSAALFWIIRTQYFHIMMTTTHISINAHQNGKFISVGEASVVGYSRPGTVQKFDSLVYPRLHSGCRRVWYHKWAHWVPSQWYNVNEPSLLLLVFWCVVH